MKMLWKLSLLCIGIMMSSCSYFSSHLKKNTDLKGKEEYFVLIPTGSNLDSVMNIMERSGVIVDMKSLRKAAIQRNYGSKIKPGRYRITDKMTNFDLVNLLASGKQVPVRITFNNIRNKQQLAGKIGNKIEADSAALMAFFNDHTLLRKRYNMDTNNIICMFLPDTYELYWNTSAEELADKMRKEYDKFWNPDRIKKANTLGLTSIQVSILASIVQAEQTKYKEEWPVIAGVYLNRLKKGMKLEADPTVIFARGDFTIKRVYFSMLTYDSPYNTYMYPGLPPGPIYLPEKGVIDAVLDPAEHNYIFMCAKDDLSGKHSFAVTGAEHEANSARYRRALDKAGIR